MSKLKLFTRLHGLVHWRGSRSTYNDLHCRMSTYSFALENYYYVLNSTIPRCYTRENHVHQAAYKAGNKIINYAGNLLCLVEP